MNKRIVLRRCHLHTSLEFIIAISFISPIWLAMGYHFSSRESLLGFILFPFPPFCPLLSFALYTFEVRWIFHSLRFFPYSAHIWYQHAWSFSLDGQQWWTFCCWPPHLGFAGLIFNFFCQGLKLLNQITEFVGSLLGLLRWRFFAFVLQTVGLLPSQQKFPVCLLSLELTPMLMLFLRLISFLLMLHHP